MDEIQANLDAMIDLVTQVYDEKLCEALALTLQRLHNAYSAYITAMYQVMSEAEVAVTTH